jgi:hypothetical protein
MMDTENIIKQSRARFDYNRAKQILQEKYEAKMLFAHNGGMWRAGPELLMTLAVCPDEDCVLIDEYGTPIKINTLELELLAQQRWQEQMNGWLNEFNEIASR